MSDDSPSASGASNVLLNQRSLTAPFHRAPVHIQGDENPGMAIGFDGDGILTAISVGGSVMGALGDGATDDTEALQDALTAGAGTTVRIPKAASFYRLTGRLIAPANTHIMLENGAELKWTATTPTGPDFLGQVCCPGLEVMGDNFRIEGKGKLTGPAGGVYVSNEVAILMLGTATGSRKSGFVVEGVEFSNWGSYGVCLEFVDNVQISGCSFHNLGYAGVMACSCTHGVVQGNEFHTITPGTSGNAFGISLNHDSEDYDSDPNAATNGRAATHPFCIDWDISANEVRDIPLWTGIDSHGGYEISVHHNKVFNCKHGIHVASGSGDAANYAGENNSICDNVIDSRKRDGTAGTPNAGIGINVSGASAPVVRHRRVRVSGNFVYGFGVVSDPGNAAAIGASTANGLLVEGNIIESWGGVGVVISGTQDALVSENLFRQLASGSDTIACAIRNQTADVAKQTLIGNVLDTNGGTAAKEGFRTTSVTRPTLVANDFRAATVGAVVLAAGNFGSDLPVSTSVNLGGAGGTTVLNLSEFLYGATEIIVRLTASAPITITNITGVPAYTRVVLLAENGSSAITFSRATSALGGSADFVSTAYDTLSLMCYATAGGVQWVELGRAING